MSQGRWFVSAAFSLMVFSAGAASAQQAPPLASAHRPAPVRLGLSASPPELRLRLSLPENSPAPVECAGPCQLWVLPGTYVLEAEPPPGSGLRRVRKRVKLERDSVVDVQPGSRAEHGWGLGLTIGGGSVLGLSAALWILTGGGAESDDRLILVTGLGVGAAMTATGITLLVMGRNRVSVRPWLPAVQRGQAALALDTSF